MACGGSGRRSRRRPATNRGCRCRAAAPTTSRHPTSGEARTHRRYPPRGRGPPTKPVLCSRHRVARAERPARRVEPSLLQRLQRLEQPLPSRQSPRLLLGAGRYDPPRADPCSWQPPAASARVRARGKRAVRRPDRLAESAAPHLQRSRPGQSPLPARASCRRYGCSHYARRGARRRRTRYRRSRPGSERGLRRHRDRPGQASAVTAPSRATL